MGSFISYCQSKYKYESNIEGINLIEKEKELNNILTIVDRKIINHYENNDFNKYVSHYDDILNIKTINNIKYDMLDSSLCNVLNAYYQLRVNDFYFDYKFLKSKINAIVDSVVYSIYNTINEHMEKITKSRDFVIKEIEHNKKFTNSNILMIPEEQLTINKLTYDLEFKSLNDEKMLFNFENIKNIEELVSLLRINNPYYTITELDTIDSILIKMTHYVDYLRENYLLQKTFIDKYLKYCLTA